MSEPSTDDALTATDAARQLLEREQVHLRAQLGELDPQHGGSDFDENFADSGQVAAEQGENRALASQLQEQLDDVDRALGKLDEGRYGQCDVCGSAIGEARLEVMPAARFCIEHAGS
jgi:RNA polymerase-binding transcription factor DksA